MGETISAANISGAALGTLAAAGSARAAALSGEKVTDLIEKLPADYETAQSACRELLSGGAETISLLVEMVGEQFGDRDGAKAKTALHGLAHFVCRPDANKERGLLAETLAGQLQGDRSEDQKAFVVR